eukprot:2591411-Pyramimonas_sp.AAC.1
MAKRNDTTIDNHSFVMPEATREVPKESFKRHPTGPQETLGRRHVPPEYQRSSQDLKASKRPHGVP